MSNKPDGRKKLKRTDWNAIVAAVIFTIIALAVMATAGLWAGGWGVSFGSSPSFC
ncbi:MULTISPECIES: hypothetical protein [unclassified Paracoccus (in: a-proteobacteria)]|uniref:hypothetical protein n=1 Tax=unclassified Paracoccus (in: a-proteobacteria) TaxID=2688777 RepID=UPI0012B312BF|nr:MULTISPECIES: hypothetical protein [unclassified Paracoccus (in: a-proteobacteria)]UXU75638.1 hypothetical protein GB879_003855 [Paracoccus sp. SMMA_5]UXU81543.1 hypothetical protein GB880_003845 [Paracoccus sp. SMMA_5_TC]